MKENKRISTLVVMMALAVMAFGVIGTGAWFTAQDTTGNTTATAGTLSIDARDNGGTLASGATLTDMAPGVWTDWDNINIFNNGSLDAKYRLQSQFVSQSVGGFYGQIVVEAAHGFANGCPPSGPAPVQKYLGPLADLEVDSSQAIADPLEAGNTHKWCFRFKLDEDAGNTFQGQTATFNFVVDATQYENPGWSQ